MGMEAVNVFSKGRMQEGQRGLLEMQNVSLRLIFPLFLILASVLSYEAVK